jgi:hypothetical protein
MWKYSICCQCVKKAYYQNKLKIYYLGKSGKRNSKNQSIGQAKPNKKKMMKVSGFRIRPLNK